MKNVNVSGFYAGMRICHVVNNGLVENVSVYNCFSNGIESYGNEITFKNMNYGKCGAAGIELCPEAAYQAGVNFNKAQTVTFAGKIITDNYNKGDTIYMNNFTAMGIPVYTILQGVLQAYPKEVLSNVMTSEGQFVFISFIFNQIDEGVLNPSVINYEDIDGAGIVNINNLTGVNTTHKYIELDVVVPALGGSAGRVLLYNVNYQG